jgi:hypothetical protein
MGTAEVIRSDDLASYMNIDPNQMRSALDMFAQEGVLFRVEMIECTYCQMAALRSEYQEALDEDDEYRCTSCDRPLRDKKMRIIRAYRRGEKWQEASILRDRSGDADNRVTPSSSTSKVMLDEQGWYTQDRFAEVYKVGKEALRKRLDRFRKHNLDDWRVNEDRRPREVKYLYQLRAVKPIVEELRASSQRPAK